MKCPSCTATVLAMSERQGVDIDEHDRSEQGSRKKSWLDNIFD